MDYRTKPISREKLRNYAGMIRKLFKCRNKYFFNVVSAFEVFPIWFPNVSIEIVCDDDPELKDVPGTTIPDFNGNYCIKVKESVYNYAHFKKNGGYRMHIMHEMCHVFLFMLGYLPCIDRTYKNNELTPYESVEWQAKALAGEVLIPYESTKGLSLNQIVKKCKVSKDAAKKRIDLNKREE